MTEEEKKEDEEKASSAIIWKKFLEECPPGKPFGVCELTYVPQKMMEAALASSLSYQSVSHFPVDKSKYRRLSTPPLTLYCLGDHCKGERFFELDFVTTETLPDTTHKSQDIFMRYLCNNCKKPKTFAISYGITDYDEGIGYARKFGEMPPFGPNIPAKAIALIGPDKDIFLNGHRSESRAMGIGAFAYYRRVVENQKNRILDEIIKVAKKIKADSKTIEFLEAGKKETQFSKAMETVKDAIPKELLFDGQHNPLTLLHGAVSKGMHAETDEECLAYAQHIREILFFLAERTQEVLKERASLQKAIEFVAKKRSRKKTNQKHGPKQ